MSEWKICAEKSRNDDVVHLGYFEGSRLTGFDVTEIGMFCVSSYQF